MLVAQHIAKSETLTVTLNKESKEVTGLPFDDISSQLPITLSDKESGVKAVVDWELELQEFILDLNGEPFENYMYLDSAFSLEASETKIMSAEIVINGKTVSKGGCEWQPVLLQHKIWAVIEDHEPITSIKVIKLRETTTGTINEIISLLALQDNIPSTGLLELVLDKWKGLDEPLDDSVMQQLLVRCQNIKTLKITSMNILEEHVRSVMAR